MEQKIKIVIADDHPIVVQGISSLLATDARFDVMASYDTGAALLEGLRQQLPDVLLLDIHFPDTTGNKLARIISKEYPALRMIAITSVDNSFDMRDMLQNGCAGYLLKSAGLPVLKEAIETVYAGNEFLEPDTKEQLFRSMLRDNLKPGTFKLTQREQQVLDLLAEGKTNSEIAELLFLSPRTIENNRMSLYQKLDVKNTAELIKTAMRLGLII